MGLIETFDRILKEKGWKERPYQRAVLEKIDKAIRLGRTVIFICAPTGFGKTLVNYTIAASIGDSFYVTGNLSLQDQIIKDFSVADIRGRDNYKCPYGGTCAEGPCMMEKDFECKYSCPYIEARERALEAPIVLTNIFYFCLEGGRTFGSRELLIVDEGHNIPEQLVQFGNVTVSRRTVGESIWRAAKEMYMSGDTQLVNKLIEMINFKLKEFEDYDKLSKDELKVKRRFQMMKVRLENLRESKDSLVTYHTKHEYEWLLLQPIYARRVAQKLLFDRGVIKIISSATLNYRFLLRELGIPSSCSAYIGVPSIFPPENRPIYLCPVMNFSYKNQTPDRILKMRKRIGEIILKHPQEKGIVFAQGYRYAEMIEGIHEDFTGEEREELFNRIVYHDKENRKKVLNRWIESLEPRVLVGVSFEEGLDLKYDLCRFAIVFKSPFPDTSDPRVKWRIEHKHWFWAYMLAQQKLLQAYGRICRAEDDYGALYVLDAQACRLFTRKGTPKYVMDAIRYERSLFDKKV